MGDYHLDDIMLYDQSPYSYGVELAGGSIEPIIEANTPIPVSK